MSIRDQIERNLVAIVSLTIALTALTYNTWRNEQSEENRNLRTASVHVLLKLGELQVVIFRRHYDLDTDVGNPRTGWAYVLTIRDLTTVLPNHVKEHGDQLVTVWQKHWENLGTEQASIDAIIKAMDTIRSDVLLVLASLG